MKRIAATTVLAPVAWGTTYVTITELLPADRPLTVAALRVLPAGVLLAALGRRRTAWRPSGPQWRHLAVLATCNLALFFPLLVVAVGRMPGGVAAAFGGLQPLLVAGLGALADRRRPALRDLAVGVVAVVGVALVALRPGAAVDATGIVAAVGANVAFATGVVLTRRLPAPPDRVAATGWQLLLAAAALVPLALVVEGSPPTPGVAALLGWTHLSVAATGAAFVLWFDGIRRLPAAAPPLLGLAAPVTGAVLGWALLGQDLAPTQLVGFALVVGAIARGALAGPPSDRCAPAGRKRPTRAHR